MRRIANVVGQTIARIRSEKGWTQDYLVDRLQLLGCGMTRAVLANIETRRSTVTDTQLFAIAAALGINPQELLPQQWRSKLQQVFTTNPPVIRQRRRKRRSRKARS